MIVVRSSDVVCRRVGGEIVLLPTRRGVTDLEAVYVLNEVGAWLWDRLERPRTRAELGDGVVAAFEVDRAQAERDVAAFTDALVSTGLAVETPA